MSAAPAEDLTALLPLEVIATLADDELLVEKGFSLSDIIAIQYSPPDQWPMELRHRFVVALLVPDPLDED